MLKVQTPESKFKLYFILFFLLLMSIIFFKLIYHFIVPSIIALSLCSLLYPLYQKILKKLKNKKNLASLLTCLILIVFLLIPAALLVFLLSQQTMILYDSLEPFIKNLNNGYQLDFVSQIKQYKFYDFLVENSIDWQSITLNIAKKLLSGISFLVNQFSQSIFRFSINLLITFFCMFYFFRDGEKFLNYLESISPLQRDHEIKLFENFTRISRATVKGTLLIGILQGSLGALTLLFFGIKTWILWGFIMIICAIIPVIGTWVILVPISIIQIIMGNVWQGITMLLISTLIISNVDNLVRPYLVGRDAKMHDLIIFFSTIGGISLFGIMGFIIGPVIAALFLALLSIYQEEFKDQIS